MDYNKIVQGILDIGEAMLQSGAENFRLEDSFYRMCRSYGFKRSDVFVIPSNIQVTVETPEGEIITQIRHIESSEPNFDQLDYLNNLCRYVCHLSVCGVVMQAIVQNPLADPYVLGISSGASLGATLAIMLGIGSFLGGNSVGVTAFIGAMITSFAVIAIANMGGKATSAKLILAGMAVSAVCSAFSNFVIYITNDKNAATEVMKWSMGSLAGASWARVGVMLPVTLICVVIFWTQYRNLNLMLLGDEVSITLGTDLHRLRTFYLIVASVMIGFAVYCAGVIGFVGLVIPHVVRILFGTDHRRLLPLSALLGASFLIWCDVACRVILKNSEMPIGVLVSIIGAPCFIYLLVRKSYGFGGSK